MSTWTNTRFEVGEVQRLKLFSNHLFTNDSASFYLITFLALIESIFSPKSGGEVERMDPLNRLNFGASFCASQQDLRRGDEHYMQWIVQRFLRFYRKIGPSGTQVSMTVTRQAKHNQFGRFEYTGCTPHMDASRDQSVWHGLMWLQRVVVEGEVFDFSDYKKIFAIPTYRATKSKQRIGKRVYRTNWKHFFNDNDIYLSKITSQWRLQGIQELDDDDIDGGSIARHSGHQAQCVQMSVAQQRNYQTNPSKKTMVSRSCGNSKKIQEHQPSWTVEEATDQMFSEFDSSLAKLLHDRDNVVGRAFKTCKTRKEREKFCLYTMRGTLDSMILDIKRAMQFLASRPVDPVTMQIVQDSPNWYRKYERNSTTFRTLFSKPFFQQPVWKTFEARVKVVEDERLRYQARVEAYGNGPPADLNEAMEQRIMGALEHGLHQINQQVTKVVGLVSAPNGSAAAPTSNSFVRQGGLLPSTQSAPAIPTPLPDPVKVKKKNRGTSRAVRLQAEAPSSDGCPREDFYVEDRNCASASDYWNLWETKWKEREDNFGAGWRNDRAVTTASGAVVKSNGGHQWWSQRNVIFLYIKGCLASDIPKAEALKMADELYDAQRTDKQRKQNKRPTVESVYKAFRDAHRARTNTKRKGRPKGAKNASTIVREKRQRQTTLAQQQQQYPTPPAHTFSPSQAQHPATNAVSTRGRWRGRQRRQFSEAERQAFYGGIEISEEDQQEIDSVLQAQAERLRLDQRRHRENTIQYLPGPVGGVTIPPRPPPLRRETLAPSLQAGAPHCQHVPVPPVMMQTHHHQRPYVGYQSARFMAAHRQQPQVAAHENTLPPIQEEEERTVYPRGHNELNMSARRIDRLRLENRNRPTREQLLQERQQEIDNMFREYQRTDQNQERREAHQRQLGLLVPERIDPTMATEQQQQAHQFGDVFNDGMEGLDTIINYNL